VSEKEQQLEVHIAEYVVETRGT